MANGIKITNAEYNVTTNLTDETITKNLLKIGWNNVDFSEMDSDLVPEVQLGSSVEVEDFIYLFETDYTITGSISAGTNYVRVFDSASTGIMEYTQVVPTWDVDKKGFYDGLKRYLMIFTSTGSDYSNKHLMVSGNNQVFENDITITGSINVSEDFTMNDGDVDVTGSLVCGGSLDYADASLSSIAVTNNVTCTKLVWSDITSRRTQTFSGTSTSITKASWYSGDGWYRILVINGNGDLYVSGIVYVTDGQNHHIMVNSFFNFRRLEINTSGTLFVTGTNQAGFTIKQVWRDN